MLVRDAISEAIAASNERRVYGLEAALRGSHADFDDLHQPILRDRNGFRTGGRLGS